MGKEEMPSILEIEIHGYLVVIRSGPEKLGPGRNIPAAISLVVFSPNFSAIILICAYGYCFCSSRAVVKPTTPAPKTTNLIFFSVHRLLQGIFFLFSFRYEHFTNHQRRMIRYYAFTLLLI